ncbi:lectin-like domain-containing protein [Glycomyces tritici]|uniref:Uncharacterized protein n=1 Tax=Glycomyces tritici TaxID=2665176 RepID=A0ABT7YQC0_9ACTN|nr:hypothetical protein [Glycomyces tritici]MDN3240468.1 hypothetical protein [Glycomyces tritici]
MKRTAMFGAGSMMIAATLAAVPGVAHSQDPEAKVLLVSEEFTGTEVGDDNFASLNACLTAATELVGADAFDSCSDQATGPVPASGKQPGYLQLTDAARYDTGGVVYNKALPSKHGIEVTFSQYQYGGSAADGIAFFLVDGDTDLTETGAFGGSLGYAQFEANGHVNDGVDGGYLGLGLDAWGNFSGDTEGRGDGCGQDEQAPAHLRIETNRAPDNVALRGPGQGHEGYCLLATTATDEKIGTYPNGDIYGTDFPASLRAETLADAKRTVKLKVVPDGDQAAITVDIDFQNGDGWTRVLEAEVPDALPETFKFGLSSSTGGSTDVHLIRHLRVEAFK